jgi:hypothetical protein
MVAKQSKENDMEEIKSEEYTVAYDPAAATVTFEGTLRLYDYASYQPTEALLHKALAETAAVITLDVHKLAFINSSGLDMLFRFAHKAATRKDTQLVVRRSAHAAPWQKKLLSTMQMMAPSLQVELVDDA